MGSGRVMLKEADKQEAQQRSIKNLLSVLKEIDNTNVKAE